DCIFCGIIAGNIPSKRVFEDEQIVAFEDIAHIAPVHVLVVPKVHIASLLELPPDDHTLAAHLWSAVARVARDQGVARSGFRTVVNTGEDAGQTVFHMHVHVLGGRPMRMDFV
ncbi:MAG: histidine triad nucleotide-binding protein, partial [Firmicutes bacterium]|nr:histidine triad nucleotide-binding protein [Bacillota bacterium]